MMKLNTICYGFERKSHASLLCLLLPMLVLWVGSARAERDSREISSSISAVSTSATGVTLQLDLPVSLPGPLNHETGIIAIPPGGKPQASILSYTLSFWEDGNFIETIGPIDHRQQPGELSRYLAPKKLVDVQPLGMVRRVRLARVKIDTSHTVPGQAGQRYQVNQLTFRVAFSGRSVPLPAEPDFELGYPSGFRGIFEQGLLNAEYIPDGREEEKMHSEPVEVLPYQAHPSLRLSVTAAGYVESRTAGALSFPAGSAPGDFSPG